MAAAVPIAQVDREGRGEFALARRDKVNLAIALDALSLRVRYNLRSSGHEWNDGDGWTPANDRLDDDIRERIAGRFIIGKKPALFSREAWERCLNAHLYGHEVDPFRDWLQSLPKWDGTERLSLWLGQVFRTADDTLVRWVSRYLFLGAVARTHQPGCKLDVMPVLVGPQGCGKSTALAMMFSPDAPAGWFTDNLNLAADAKARAEALQGAVVVEVSEMTGSTRAEIQSLKAFLSRTDDGGVRLAWRRNPDRLPRRCILVGTSNEVQCLPNDWTGNRRFLVVSVEPTARGAAEVREVLDGWRIQLWAEALHLHREGVDARLPDVLAGAQAAVNEWHRASDAILEDALDAWLDTAPDDFTMQEAVEGCRLVERGGHVRPGNQNKLAALLRARGYERDENPRHGRLPSRHRYWRRHTGTAQHTESL